MAPPKPTIPERVEETKAATVAPAQTRSSIILLLPFFKYEKDGGDHQSKTNQRSDCSHSNLLLAFSTPILLGT